MSLSSLPREEKSLLIFTTRCYMDASSGSGVLNWGDWHGLDTPRSSGGTFDTEISLQNPSSSLWERHPFHIYIFPTSLLVASFINPWI